MFPKNTETHRRIKAIINDPVDQRPPLDAILTEVAIVFDLSIDIIKQAGKQRACADARKAFALIARTYDYEWRAIAKQVNRTYSTIINSAMEAQTLLKYDEHFYQQHARIILALNPQTGEPPATTIATQQPPIKGIQLKIF